MSQDELMRREEERLNRHIYGRGRPAPVRRGPSFETHSATLVATAPAKKPVQAPAAPAAPAPKPPAPKPAAPAVQHQQHQSASTTSSQQQESAPAPPALAREPSSTKPVVSATSSSLDSLVESLMGLSPRTTAAAAAAVAPAAPAPAPVPRPPAPVSKKPEPEPEPAPVSAPMPQDLDSILADLEGMARQHKPPAAAAVSESAAPPPLPERKPSPPAAPAPAPVPEPEPEPEPVPAPAPAPPAPRHVETTTTVCAACGKAIEGKHYQCQDRLFHVDCLVCSECHRPIERYNIKDGRFYCPDCFRTINPPKVCAKCGKDIAGSSVVAAGMQFHAECFTCAHCGNVITESYIEHEGKCYCPEEVSPCYKRALGKICSVCGGPLEANYLSVLGKSYHKQCFQCFSCHTVFPTLEFFPINEQPYCEACAMKAQQEQSQQEPQQQQH